MGRPSLYLIPRYTGNRQYFESQEAYQEYLKAEKELMREPVYLEFDWRYFLKYLFFGG